MIITLYHSTPLGPFMAAKSSKTVESPWPFSFRGCYNYEAMRPLFADFANLGGCIKDAPRDWRGLSAQNFSLKPRKTTEEWATYQSKEWMRYSKRILVKDLESFSKHFQSIFKGFKRVLSALEPMIFWNTILIGLSEDHTTYNTALGFIWAKVNIECHILKFRARLQL